MLKFYVVDEVGKNVLHEIRSNALEDLKDGGLEDALIALTCDLAREARRYHLEEWVPRFGNERKMLIVGEIGYFSVGQGSSADKIGEFEIGRDE